MSIKALSKEERPRERLAEYGVESLTNVDLLAVLLGKGTRSASVLDISRDVFSGVAIQDLPFFTVSRLQNFKGIGFTKACLIKAAIEFGRRTYQNKELEKQYITTPFDAFRILQPDLQGDQEKFVVLFLNSRKNVVLKKTLFIGTIDKQLISSRDVIKEAIAAKATSIIISHNHPSGELTPSDADRVVTQNIVTAMNLCQIVVDDHIIVSGNEYYSFVEHALM